GVVKPSQNPKSFASSITAAAMAMEFWGVEVKAGEPLMVEQEDGIVVHLSQASLGEVKKDKANESIVLSVGVNGKKLVIGTLSPGKCPQISYDLVFDKDFELSHSWKNGSVYFCGYKAEMDQGSDNDDVFDSSSESEEEEVPLAVPANGKPEPEAEKSKVVADKAKAA
ncbi:nucleoplasmin-like domain-containing protein, partial [Ralstonia pseudosolanacearum]|uniref:nucleoplasmin-like domain-containing protein n=1 Tax=Ralstonia pseudosolanacearum TaxID=1310165 RepID=UPI003CEC59F7